MAAAKGTAQNAKIIEVQMKAAAFHLAEALQAVRTAQEAVAAGEREAEEKLPEFANLKGLLSIAHATATRTANTWADNATARETR